jgi:uncharacterized protein YktA (UPF0223 family)
MLFEFRSKKWISEDIVDIKCFFESISESRRAIIDEDVRDRELSSFRPRDFKEVLRSDEKELRACSVF